MTRGQSVRRQRSVKSAPEGGGNFCGRKRAPGTLPRPKDGTVGLNEHLYVDVHACNNQV